MLFDGVVSAITASWGGNGASHGNVSGINASWNALAKRGIGNKNAWLYFTKTAHNSGKNFVLSDLMISSGKNALGSAVIAFKNFLKGAFSG